ncbi:50S ribosomal protein L11 methyltransferase [Iodobacter fluviatilis]|uniref:Ribosomal protein L11 methyltransferase n=1 Tax=Iodobacter fluviatilis TaxID=537 RepID=A0A377Q7Z7_9NEIS|nr:50S ribosomal protein L11 methyltransferase [Iodobacter fluviatilis]TCU84505.1 [LSU ribosomal protein L11P]-lysine N-methyltransferase [Iodobacter fluviatilis]STQ89971.1 Ribosomal protein L11 methyltransferase [Iodobacter fluviatilis]
MPWQELRITTESSQAERFSDALFDLGALSVSVEDAAAGTDAEKPIFGEPGEPVDQMWENSVVLALFDEDIDTSLIVTAASNTLKLAIPPYDVVRVEEQDWVRLTQSQFNPIPISDRLWITPTWHECPDAGAISIQLDPGLAFGTGSHPTTRLCLKWLDSNLAGGEKLLDYGCGSGILAIAGIKLGAASAAGVDIDPQAMTASRQNAEQNAVEVAFYLPDAEPVDSYDVVIANILTNPLKALAPMLAAKVKINGRIALSGILAEQADDVIAIYSQWFAMNTPQTEDGWVCLSGIRK